MRIYLPIAALIALTGIYWLVWQSSASTVREEVTEWVENERSAGRIADYESFSIRGFPYRMQIEFVSPHLGDPEAGWSWQAENLIAFVLPYRLNHMVMVAQGQQRLEFLRLERQEIVEGFAVDQRASLVLRRGDLERFALDISGLEMTRSIYFTDRPGVLDRSEIVSLGKLDLHTRRVHDNDGLPAQGRHHAVIFETQDINWIGHPYEGLGPDLSIMRSRILMAGLPQTGLGSLRSDFLADWDDNGGILFLDECVVRWSEIELAANGVVELDDQARPEGDLTVYISGYDQAIDAAVAGGALAPQYADISKTVLDVIATVGGDAGGRIRVPLRMEDGSVQLGPAELMSLEPLY